MSKLGIVAEPFHSPPVLTMRMSPIFLIAKMNGDFRLIHYLYNLCEKSVHDFFDHKFCSVRDSSVDDEEEMVKRKARCGILALADIKSASRLIIVC